MRLFRLRSAGPTRKFSFHVGEGIFGGLRGIRETLLDQFQRKYTVARLIIGRVGVIFGYIKSTRHVVFDSFVRVKLAKRLVEIRVEEDSSLLSGKLQLRN